MASKGIGVEVGGGTEPGNAGVVDEDVDLAGLLGEASDCGGIADVRGDEARPSALGRDRVDDVLSTLGIAPVDQDFGTVTGEPQRDRAADPGGRSGDERLLALEVVVIVVARGRHGCSYGSSMVSH